MATKPWGIGAWAAEAELAEEEEKAAAAAAAAAMAARPPPLPHLLPSDESFPSLPEAARQRATQKKKKQTTLSLAEFTIGQPIAQGTGSRYSSSAASRSNVSAGGLTLQEMAMLPSGPRDRSGEEERRGLGGGFRDYGADRYSGYPRERESGGFLKDRERDEPSRADDSRDWGSSKRTVFPASSGRAEYDSSEKRYSSSSAPSRPIPSERVDIAPSRADEVDNWGLVKKALPVAPPARRHASESAESGNFSRADEADSWARTKKPPTQGTDLSSHIHSRANEADNWFSSKRSVQSEVQSESSERLRERKPIVLAPPSQPTVPIEGSEAEVAVSAPPPSKPKPNPFGSARPREAVLAERGVDQQNPEIALKETSTGTASRPSSSGRSSRPPTPEASIEASAKPSRPKVNPFGDAKPREVLLEEQGKDWRKMDLELEHRAVDRPETEEERILKEQIEALKQEVEEASKQRANGGEETTDGSIPSEASASEEELRKKEKELEELVRALDDKVRFSQRAATTDRPGSRSGRSEFGRGFDMPDRAGSLPGSRPGSRSGSRPGSQSGRSDAGQSYNVSSESQSVRRTSSHTLWSRSRQVDAGGRNNNSEALERTGSWVGSIDVRQSFESLQRSQRDVSGGGNGSNSSGYSRGAGPDIWTRSNDGPRDRRGGWGEPQQHSNRVGNRRF